MSGEGNEDDAWGHGDDDGEWISQQNFDDALLRYKAGTVRSENGEANCNKLAGGKLEVDCLNNYILRCRSCFHTTSVMDKEFCPRCGYKSLQRVAFSVGDGGTMNIHLDMERLRVKRGLKYSQPLLRGGKHDVQEKLVEDQRIPHNRMAKLKNAGTDTSPFVLNDVYSRSAHLGIRSMCKSDGCSRRRNFNESTGGRRKK